MFDIVWNKRVLGALVGLVVGSQAVVFAQQREPSIRQLLRESGGYERISVTASEPLPLAHLAGDAKLVVEASIAGVRSYLNETDTDVLTDYTLTVHAVISNRQRSEVRTGDAIVVRRQSGVVVVDGRPAEVYENDFPLFRVGERFILFLAREPLEPVYTVFGGNQGAFSAGKTVTPVATARHEGAAYIAPSRDEFLGEVRALLKFSVN
jgi:hypothetical protein